MSQKTSISDDTVKIIEDALTELETNPKYGIAAGEPPQGKSIIYETFVSVIVAMQSETRVAELREKYAIEENRTCKVFAIDEHIAMEVLDIDGSICIAMFRPSKGSFDWSKLDWISRQAEFDAYKEHIERVISRYFNYRIFHGRAERA